MTNPRAALPPSSRFQRFFCLTALVTTALLPGLTSRAWAYGAAGHELVADVAELDMKDSEAGKAALARVHQILAFGESMADASTWADRVKDGAFDDDSTAFLAKVKDTLGNEKAHGAWHYVDVPFQALEYSRRDPWTRPDDVVQMVRICAETLRDVKSAPDAPVPLTQREALRLLIHYVGDMQQPLHVGCGYVKENAGGTAAFVLPTAEDLANGVKDDQGGNLLNLPFNDDRGRPTKLHSDWDTNLVTKALAGRDKNTYAAFLHDDIKPEADWQGNGNLESWPIQWANDSVSKAKIAYAGVILNDKAERGWNITLPDGYEDNMAKLTEIQLAKGGARLAQILTAVLGPTAPEEGAPVKP